MQREKVLFNGVKIKKYFSAHNTGSGGNEDKSTMVEDYTISI